MNKFSKNIFSIVATILVVGATLTPALVHAWGDNINGRSTYTIAEINRGMLGNTVVLNSITDGKIGDERNFVSARPSGDGNTWHANKINVEDGKTYTVRLYVHNNNPKPENVAKGVKATFSLPTTVAKSHTIIGYLDATNASPNRYWDEVIMQSNQDFYLEFVRNSAKFTNAKLGTVALPNEVITSSGAMLGYSALDGKIPGCFAYDGVVTIEVKAHYSASSKLTKTARIKGTQNWSDKAVTAKIGDEVEFQIEYRNLSTETVQNVMIRDILPANLEYVKDSTVVYNASHKNGVKIKDNTITTTGINIGNYAPRGNAYVRFTAKVVDQALVCGKNQLINWASSTVKTKVVKDDVSVLVVKNCPTPTPTPTPTPKPTTPKTIVNTGAGSIVTGAIGLGSVVTALGYYIASRKNL